MQDAVVTSLWCDTGGDAKLREVLVCVTVDPTDSENRALVLSSVSTIDPPFSAISIDLIELLEALDRLGAPSPVIAPSGDPLAAVKWGLNSQAAALAACITRIDELERRLGMEVADE